MPLNTAPTPDQMRGYHTGDLMILAGSHSAINQKVKPAIRAEARRQLELRASVGQKVRGVLKHMGKEFHGSGGWHVVPFVTAEGFLAYVDICRGVAVTTDCLITEAEIVAATVPKQPVGVVASGAAAHTSPDAGEGKTAKSPESWLQLLADVRRQPDSPTIEISAKIKLYGYGFVTCYNDQKVPFTEIDAEYGEPDTSFWAFTQEQSARVRTLARELVGDEAALIPKLPKAPDDYYSDVGRLCRTAALTLVSECWADKAFFAGDRTTDIYYTAELAGFYQSLLAYLMARVSPVAVLLADLPTQGEYPQTRIGANRQSQFTSALTSMALAVGRAHLLESEDRFRKFVRETATAILYENGPIVVGDDEV